MKYLVNSLALLLVALIIFFAIQKKSIFSYKPTKKLIDTTGALINATKHNLAMEVSPGRSPKITLIEKEAYLRMFAPDLFSNFNERDWQKFWAIIYQPVKDKSGGFVIKRYRTKEEIMAILVDQYPNPFSFLQKEHWDIFWQDVVDLDLDKEVEHEE
ncbi:MAG: hypothetical protein ABH865_08360 [Candidatus Omnitrophota bacterium]|nr:hypothetical protein [Candidatus Omnitrophota bacterium]